MAGARRVQERELSVVDEPRGGEAVEAGTTAAADERAKVNKLRAHRRVRVSYCSLTQLCRMLSRFLRPCLGLYRRGLLCERVPEWEGPRFWLGSAG